MADQYVKLAKAMTEMSKNLEHHFAYLVKYSRLSEPSEAES